MWNHWLLKKTFKTSSQILFHISTWLWMWLGHVFVGWSKFELEWQPWIIGFFARESDLRWSFCTEIKPIMERPGSWKTVSDRGIFRMPEHLSTKRAGKEKSRWNYSFTPNNIRHQCVFMWVDKSFFQFNERSRGSVKKMSPESRILGREIKKLIFDTEIFVERERGRLGISSSVCAYFRVFLFREPVSMIWWVRVDTFHG
jgi:hypothetical protein